MRVVYAQQPFPASWSRSIFLAGPTPRREPPAESWRPRALALLAERGYDGVVFVPEPEDGSWPTSYQDQFDWEHRALHLADIIVFWVPRDLAAMPAFTTNVEFGYWVTSHKCVLGRPSEAPKNRYLDVLLEEVARERPQTTLEGTLEEAIARLGEGAHREGGERCVPLHLWRTPLFQSWYQALRAAGNRLDDARVRWTFYLPGPDQVFAAVLWVSVWVAAEGRHKSNEWIFGRTDICAVVLYQGPDTEGPFDWMGAEVVLVREFRAPGRTEDGFVHELPSGSSFKRGRTLAEIAAEEAAEETGLALSPERLVPIGSRQTSATVSTHHAHLFAAEISREEMEAVRAHASAQTALGNRDETERTVVEIATPAELFASGRVDWATLGMICQALLSRGALRA